MAVEPAPKIKMDQKDLVQPDRSPRLRIINKFAPWLAVCILDDLN
jgi:hypothetical protein